MAKDTESKKMLSSVSESTVLTIYCINVNVNIVNELVHILTFVVFLGTKEFSLPYILVRTRDKNKSFREERKLAKTSITNV